MPAKSKSTKKTVSFDEYKTIKDKIIEISEQRFENILSKRLLSFRQEFKTDLMAELNPRFDSVEKRLSFLTWFMPVLITLILTAFKLFP